MSRTTAVFGETPSVLRRPQILPCGNKSPREGGKVWLPCSEDCQPPGRRGLDLRARRPTICICAALPFPEMLLRTRTRSQGSSAPSVLTPATRLLGRLWPCDITLTPATATAELKC